MKKTILSAIAVLSWIAAVSAQTSPAGMGEPVTLTLDEALEIALSENPTIRVANMEIEKQKYVKRETAGNLYPSLSATGQYVYTVSQQSMSREGLSFGADNAATFTGNLSLPLFAPSVYATLKMNNIQMENAVEAARSSRVTLANEVKKAYYGILLAEQSLEVLLSSEATIQQTVDNTQQMLDNELSSEYDLLTAQVQLSNLQPTIIQTRNSIDISKRYFKMLLSLPQEMDVTVTGELADYSETLNADAQVFSTDLADNTDLRNIDIQERMLNQQIKIINTQRMPTLAAFGSYTVTGNDMPNLDFSSIIGGGEMTPQKMGWWWQQPANVGLQISVPIFSGFKINNSVKQARNNLSQLQTQRDYLEESMKLNLQTAINNIIAAREKIVANEKTVEQANKAYTISNVRYNAGAGTILELNSSELQLTQARLNYSQAIYDLLAAQADYEKTLGREYQTRQ